MWEKVIQKADISSLDQVEITIVIHAQQAILEVQWDCKNKENLSMFMKVRTTNLYWNLIKQGMKRYTLVELLMTIKV